MRKDVCQDIEDIIHQFQGNKPINRWNNVMQRSKEIADSDETFTTDELYRAWKSVINMDSYSN